MPIPRPVLVLALPLLMVGCGTIITSAPVVPDAHAEFEHRLLGEWEYPDDDETIVVISRLVGRSPAPDGRKAGRAYAVTFAPAVEVPYDTSRAVPPRLEARLGRLGSRLVLDIQPPSGQVPEVYEDLMLRAHLVGVIEFVNDDELRLMELDTRLVLDDLRSGTLDLDYSVTSYALGYQLVLHAGTETLREQLASYLNRPGVLTEYTTLIRRP